LDLYTYYVLAKLKEITPSLPPHPGDHLRVFYIRKHAQDIFDHLGKEVLYKFKPKKIEIDEIVEHRKDMILKLPVSAMDRISKEMAKQCPLNQAKFIYSMWAGYLEKDDYYFKFCEKFQVELLKIHVSGHAYLDALQKLAKAINPRVLIPVHTLSGDNFSDYFDNVLRINDGVVFEL
jgi:ribonuclease J